MTPQEKATELVMKFHASESEDGYNDVRDLHSAYRCALIVVDEIIKSNPYSPSDFHPLPHFKAGQYWKEVKQELEKL